MKDGSGKYLLICLGIVVIAAIAGGLWILGSPSVERERRMDVTRVDDLSSIGRTVDLYWSRHGELPASLTDLQRQAGTARDPGTMQPYEYRVLDRTKYEVCATFQQEATASRSRFGVFWNHGAGRVCFVLEAHKLDPSRI